MNLFNKEIQKENNIDVTQKRITQIDENKKIASMALKRVDQYIKSKEYQKALLEVNKVKEIDPKNVYALALEERIKDLQKEDALKKSKINDDNNEKKQNSTNQYQTFNVNKIQLEVNDRNKTQSVYISNKNSNEQNKEHNNQTVSNKQSLNSTNEVYANNNFNKRNPIVLLIDDDINLLSVLSNAIESYGFDVLPVPTSDEAYVLIQKIPPDIIICDINLETSTIGGFTFYERLHQCEKYKNIPFIFLTGLNDDVLIRMGKEMGVDDYLTKPIKTQDLVASIRGKLKRFAELGINHSNMTKASPQIQSFI